MSSYEWSLNQVWIVVQLNFIRSYFSGTLHIVCVKASATQGSWMRSGCTTHP